MTIFLIWEWKKAFFFKFKIKLTKINQIKFKCLCECDPNNKTCSKGCDYVDQTSGIGCSSASDVCEQNLIENLILKSWETILILKKVQMLLQ